MDSEGRSPLRIFHHAPIISEVFTTVLFLSTESLPTTRGRIPTGSANAASANRYWGKFVALKADAFHRENVANVPLRLDMKFASGWDQNVASANLTRLDFDGVRQVHGTFHELSNRKVLPMLDVPLEHAGLHPLKAPGVFHREDGIRSGDHAAEDEAAIRVALVPAEHFQMRFGVFRHKGDHHAGDGFVSSFCESLHGHDATNQEHG